MKHLFKTAAASAAIGLLAGALMGAAGTARADTITLRIASGHPPGVVYAGLMKNYFQPELEKRVAARTDHTIKFVEGYSGSIVKVTEVFEGVQNGIVDIGGFCYCFEASKLPLHAFQVMLPFGTMDPTVSLAIAQDVYKAVPFLTEVGFTAALSKNLFALTADATAVINKLPLAGQRHFHGGSTSERVPLLAVVNERTTRFWRVHNRKQ